MDEPVSDKDPLVTELTRVSNRRFDMLDEMSGQLQAAYSMNANRIWQSVVGI